ncbi:IS5 family transposase [Paraburkholderia sp. JPY419]
MNVHAIRITTTEVSDREGMDAVLPADVPMDRVIADGAYYSIERTEALSGAGVTPVIPTASSRCRTRRAANPPA